MSEPFHVSVGTIVQRNWNKMQTAFIMMNFYLGAKSRITEIGDGYVGMVYLDGEGAGGEYTMPYKWLTAEWFIPD